MEDAAAFLQRLREGKQVHWEMIQFLKKNYFHFQRMSSKTCKMHDLYEMEMEKHKQKTDQSERTFSEHKS